MKKNIYLALATSLLVSSCTSYNQVSAGYTGAMLGSNIGKTVGFLTSGRGYSGRNQALGSLIGMGVGAAVGVGIANSIEHHAQGGKNRNKKNDNDDSYNYAGNHQGNADYQIGGGNNASVPAYLSPSSNGTIVISDLTYMDADGDGNISKHETCQIEAYIKNVSDKYLDNITISVITDKPKRVALSNPLMTSLAPGQKVRYTGRVYCMKAKKKQGVQLQMIVDTGINSLDSEVMFIPMK